MARHAPTQIGEYESGRSATSQPRALLVLERNSNPREVLWCSGETFGEIVFNLRHDGLPGDYFRSRLCRPDCHANPPIHG